MILRTEMKTVQKCTYNYINADVMGMKSYMMRIKWKEELQNKTLRKMWCTFLSILNKCERKKVCANEDWEKKEKRHVDGSAAHKTKKENIQNMTSTRSSKQNVVEIIIKKP